MNKCKMTLDVSQRIDLRVGFIKETKEPFQQIEELKKLLEILEAEDVTKIVMDELKIKQAKKEHIFAHTKYKAYSFFKKEFEYFKSVSASSQGCIDNLVNKAEGYLFGRIGGLNLTRKQLWEDLWEIYEEICCKLVESGNNNLIDGKAITYVREEISWECNPHIDTQKNNNDDGSLLYLMSCTPKLYCEKINKPECIQNLLEIKKIQDKRLHSNHLTDLLDTLLLISSLHNFKPLKPDLSKNTWAESLGLTSNPTPLQLDNKLVQFNNQFRISHIIASSYNFLKMVKDAVERFILLIKEKISFIKSLKGPKMKSHLSQLTHDWYFVQMYQLVVAAIGNGLQPPQQEIINLAKQLKSLPEYLKPSVSDNLLEETCKEIAKITDWNCPGGRPLKKKTPPIKHAKR